MPKIEGELKLCEHGYHLVKAEEILEWVKEDCQIFEVEPKGKVTYDGSKGVCRSARLVKQLKWDDRIARLFACDCAERVLKFFKGRFPNDKRPRLAIETARKFANGLATKEELAAARAAAWVAAGAAAWVAAGAAARDAARAAAGAAAWVAAWDAARVAAWDAARDAARAAAGAAAWVAAWVAEKKWQVKRLLQYLNGKVG
jgi:hypothetical protein